MCREMRVPPLKKTRTLDNELKNTEPERYLTQSTSQYRKSQYKAKSILTDPQ